MRGMEAMLLEMGGRLSARNPLGLGEGDDSATLIYKDSKPRIVEASGIVDESVFLVDDLDTSSLPPGALAQVLFHTRRKAGDTAGWNSSSYAKSLQL